MLNKLFRIFLCSNKNGKLQTVMHEINNLHIKTVFEGVQIAVVNNSVNFVSSRCNCTVSENLIECWKCGIKKQSIIELFCAKCKTIQNPHDYKNYFSVMGLEQVYNLDTKELVQKYRYMQTLLHPDKYTRKSDEEQKISEEYSALVNRAFKTLQSPLKRAIHMLKLNGEQITEKDTIDDKNFLSNIMDIGDEIEECQTFQQLKKQEDKNNLVLETLSQQIGECLKLNDIKGAKNLTLRMQYYYNISKQINECLRDMGHIDD